jgi:CreA protein
MSTPELLGHCLGAALGCDRHLLLPVVPSFCRFIFDAPLARRRPDEFRNWRYCHREAVQAVGIAHAAFGATPPDPIDRRVAAKWLCAGTGFKRSVFKWVTPNDKLASYGLDDPDVEGVACHFTIPERGGLTGRIGVAEEVSDISLGMPRVSVSCANLAVVETHLRKR